MSRYPKYKPTGIEWLGDIPEHWGYKRLKYNATVQPSNVDKKTIKGEVEVLLCNYMDVYKNEFIDNSINFMKASATSNEIEKFKIEKGDVLVTKDSEAADDIANPACVINNFNGVLCGYHLTQIKPNLNIINGRYLFRLFQVNKFKAQFEVAANGVTRFGVGVSAFSNAFITLPPLKEQTAIANYLDKKTVAIDTLITKKQKLIKLLQEERTAIINKAVTKGINPKVKLKPTSIDWLGDIPEHWEVKKLKYLAKILNGQDHKNVWDENGQYPIMGTGGEFGRSVKYLHLGPSVLLGRKGTIDKPQFIEEPFWSVDTAYYTDIYPTTNPKFFFYSCKTIRFEKYKYGSAVPSMTQETLNQIVFATPKLTEQTQIVDFIEKQTEKIDTTIEKIEKEINLLDEYRTSLISEVVTGKLKVI